MPMARNNHLPPYASVATPKKNSSRRARCPDCPCEQFQSDDEIISSVESDTRTEALVGWLSSASFKRDGRGGASEGPRPCPRRIQASVAILNATRDACRPYLETSSLSSATLPPSPGNVGNAQRTVGEYATYEDSFPSLSSSSPSTAPTLLVGRKKSKVSTKPPSSCTAPTAPVGRKRGKGPKSTKLPSTGCHAMKNNANATTKSHVGSEAEKHSITSNRDMSVGEGNPPPRATKVTKSVTVSISAGSSFLSGSHDQKSINIGRNPSSLPSQDALGMSWKTTIQVPPLKSKVAQTPTHVMSYELAYSEGNGTLTNRAASDIKNEPTNNVPNNDPSTVQKSRRRRLISIYTSILKSHLAPSILLELHLLVRLVSLSEKSYVFKPVDSGTISPFSEMFQTEKSCRDFAAETFASLEPLVVNLGHEIISMLVTLPALQRHCPGFCQTLQGIIRAGDSALIFEADEKALGADANTPHLTLPFDHARDSRHNYRSVDLNRLFKEREGLRDAFLYQLRAFQDVRGRLMEEKHIEAIRHQSREMLKNLSTNTLWFVTFFCDLLLQIGLVPLSETDSEVLEQIGDKKRLQKLHMRFTSQSGHMNKSSRNIKIDHNGPSPGSHGDMPEHSFPGHQEFFSIFLRAGDSYKFNVQLKRRLAQIITEMMTVNKTKGLCEHIAKTQMLAKFLGMLEFSPNWNLSSGSTEITDICLPPIDIKECIEAAWAESRLVIVIPWVVQFLLMMKWDDTSRRFKYYTDTFSLLWSINLYCLPYQLDHHCYYQTNMIMISLQLDNLFLNVVGLAPAYNLPILGLPTRISGISTNSSTLVLFDDLPLWYNKPFLFSSIPYLKDLYELVKAQEQGRMPVTSSAKKVRPNKVNMSGIELIESSHNDVSRIPFSGDNMSPWSSKRPGTPANKGGIKERLIDSFFHQHKALQQLCEMVIDRAITNFSKTISQSLIPSIFKNGATSFEEYFNKPTMTLQNYMMLLKALEIDAQEEATTKMNADFGRIIKGTLQLLAPPEIKQTVVEIACSLSISHATNKAGNIIRSLICEEKKKLVDEYQRKEKKSKAGVPLSSSKRSHSQHKKWTESCTTEIQSIIGLTASLRAFDESGGCRLEQLKQQKKEVIDQLQTCFIGTESSQSVVEFEVQIISMLKKFFSSSSSKCASLLEASIEVAEVLSLLGKLGYATLPNKQDLESLLCNTNNMSKLVHQAKYANETAHSENSISHDSIGNFLFVLIEGSLICYQSLEKALLHLAKVGNEGKSVSRVLLDRLASSRAGKTNTADGLVIMVRLQRELNRDKRQQEQNLSALEPTQLFLGN